MEVQRQAPFSETDEPVLAWNIGPVTVTRVVEGITIFPIRIFLPSLTTEQIDAAGEWAAPYVTADHRGIRLSTHSFIVETPASVIVVDTCVGTHTPRVMGTDPSFFERLDAAIPGGRGAVDIVVCTHLHFDHVGCNAIEVDGVLRPAFPNARYVVSRTELDATLNDDHMAVVATSVQPLLDADVVDPVDPDHHIDDWVALIPSPGHSPGHVCIEITTGDDTALITGDAAHSPLQFTYPAVSADPADHDSAQATRTREQLLDRLVDTDTLVLGTHFPTPTAGHLRSGTHPWIDPVPGHPAPEPNGA